MNGSFGIDHPLIAVRNIEKLRRLLVEIGFNMTAIGKHPWGTSTSLAMFDGCLLEIMGIYDPALVDQMPAGDFRFGRHVYEHLMEREGIALTALHSNDVLADTCQAQEAGFLPAGQLEFGRDVTLPNGHSGKTRTSLVLFPDKDWPRLSLFLCQQHRPELIYVPEWLSHPNSVHGICGITLVADPDSQAAILKKFSSLYGPAVSVDGGFQMETANGTVRLLSHKQVEADLGKIPAPVLDDPQPCIVAMDFKYASAADLRHCLLSSGVDFLECNKVFTLKNAENTGNTFLRFVHHEQTDPIPCV